MLLLLPWINTPYMEILKTIFRFIMLAELVQNSWAWSLTVGATRPSTLIKQARWDLVTGPWRTSPDHNDEHRLDDVFLEDDTAVVDSDEDRQFDEGNYIFGEGMLDGGDIIDRGLELDDEYSNFRP